jgi:hypothetical protein
VDGRALRRSEDCEYHSVISSKYGILGGLERGRGSIDGDRGLVELAVGVVCGQLFAGYRRVSARCRAEISNSERQGLVSTFFTRYIHPRFFNSISSILHT